MTGVPEGFRKISRPSPFNALADLALGYAMLARSGDKPDFVTAHLAVVQRIGARLAFANCYLVCGERRLVRASAIFARGEAGG